MSSDRSLRLRSPGALLSGSREAHSSDHRLPRLGRANLAVALLGALCWSCTTDTIVVEGENLQYHHSPSLIPCAGTPAFMDGFPAFMAESLGRELPPSTDLEYRWLDSASFERESPRDEVEGIAIGEVARSRTPVLTHELVHAVLSSHSGYSGNSFFDEGAAHAYTPLSHGGRLLAGDHAEIAAVDIMAEIANPHVEYYVAGSFVGFLLYRHGPAKLLDLLRALGPGLSLPGIKLAFIDVYGVSLEREVDSFASSTAETTCDDEGFPVLPYECAQESAGSVRGEPWEFAWAAECADDRSIGGVGELYNPLVEVAFTIDVEVAGVYTIELVNPGPAEGSPRDSAAVLMGPCIPCPFVRDFNLANYVPLRSVELAEGRYYVRISAPPDLSQDTGLRIYTG